MANFAVLDSENNILNTILCESKELAEQITGYSCVEFTPDDNAEVGGSYIPSTNTFIKRKPFQSWNLDENSNWVPPVAKPVNQYIYLWNEKNQVWVQQPDPITDSSVIDNSNLPESIDWDLV
jgi:hypothetical protein